MVARAEPKVAPADFLIARGGPVCELQRRLNLLHRHTLAAGKRAVLFAAIAVLVPMIGVGATRRPLHDLVSFVHHLLT